MSLSRQRPGPLVKSDRLGLSPERASSAARVFKGRLRVSNHLLAITVQEITPHLLERMLAVRTYARGVRGYRLVVVGTAGRSTGTVVGGGGCQRTGWRGTRHPETERIENNYSNPKQAELEDKKSIGGR